MSNEPVLPLIDELCIQIERAWADRRDRKLIEKLIREQPEHEDEMMDFFEALLLEELTAEPGPEISAEAIDAALELARKDLIENCRCSCDSGHEG